MKYFANELGCLSQGVGNRVRSNGTIFYLRHDKIPTDKRKDVKYGQMFCNTIPQNDVPHWTSPMVGGNLIIFPGDVSTTTVDRKTASLLFNSTISTKGAWFLWCEIKGFYLGTPINRYEYIR